MSDRKVSEMTEEELKTFIRSEVHKTLHMSAEQEASLKERFPFLFMTEKDNPPTELPDWARKA